MNYEERLNGAKTVLKMEATENGKVATDAQLEEAAKSISRGILTVRITHLITDYIVTAGLIALAAGLLGIDPFKMIFAVLCLKTAVFGRFFETRSELVASETTTKAMTDFIKGLK